MIKMESLNTTRLQASRNVEKQNVYRTPVPIKNYKSARIYNKGPKTEKRKLNEDLIKSPPNETDSAEPWSPLNKAVAGRDSMPIENDRIASNQKSSKKSKKKPTEEIVG